MNNRIEIFVKDGISIAQVLDDGISINNTQDTLDLIADCNYNFNGTYKIILNEEQINPDFFDLKTGIAGEVLQKFSNYRCQLAIVGDFTKFNSKSLTDFIMESNKSGNIFFVENLEEATKRLMINN